MHLANYVDEALGQCGARRAFYRAPRVPIAGTFTAPTLNGELQIDLFILDDIIALHIMDVFSKNPLLAPARSKNPRKFGMPYAADC